MLPSHRHTLLILCSCFTLGSLACGGGEEAAPDDTSEVLIKSGGDATVFDVTRNAFGQAAPNLASTKRQTFFAGNKVFNQKWEQAPGQDPNADGLGPLFNASACASCHVRDGGANPYREDGEPNISLVFALRVLDVAKNPQPLPNYGFQFNTRALTALRPEGRAEATFEEVKGTYKDGASYTLIKPTFNFTGLAYEPFPMGTLIGPRAAPKLIGLGLLEAVPEEFILNTLADEDDANGDGISGRANLVRDVKTRETKLGRFGWKASQPSIEQQNANAFLFDIGITSTLYPEEDCAKEGQETCIAAPRGANQGGVEVDDKRLADLNFYVAAIGPPARRNVKDDEVAQGEELFKQANCTGCHVESMKTGDSTWAAGLSGQEIRPYTDLLLHDMGPELADGLPQWLATGSEWRTPALWGIGLVETVNEHTRYLHDGRARSLEEAILWHGGEAAASRDAFKALKKAQRAALIAFLKSL